MKELLYFDTYQYHLHREMTAFTKSFINNKNSKIAQSSWSKLTTKFHRRCRKFVLNFEQDLLLTECL